MSKKNKHKKRKQRAHVGHSIGFFFKIVFMIFLILGITITGAFYLKYGRTIFKLQEEAKNLVWSSSKDSFRQYQTSIFYDMKGRTISSLSGERRLYYVNYEDIPVQIVDAVITIEDKRYFEHDGVDFIANVRAAVALIQNEGKIKQGASTITQQLARNIFLSNEVTIQRKLKEIFIASELEKKYTKQQILEFYLNNIYYGNGYYGIQAAAYGYFNKSISELSLSEIAFLTAIPNSPTLYNPLTNKKNTYHRRDKILLQMYEDGLIDEKKYQKAVDKKVKLVANKKNRNDYVETYMYQCTIEALMEKQGFEFKNSFASEEDKESYEQQYQVLYDECQSMLYTGGFRVYTTIDLDKQEQLQQVLDNKLDGFGEKSEEGIYKLQGSAVCIDNENGKVVAIIGGRSQNLDTYTLNRAYQSYRQPGSAIKPLIVYTPYFEIGHNPEEMVLDEKTEDGPKNSNGIYSGEISIRSAVELSKNTVAWNLFEELTPKKGLSYLKKMNFKKISNKDEVLAASLGGFTYGTNTLEMAAAYSTIENDGVYRNPTCIERIMSADGEEIITPNQRTTTVYDTNVARIMTNVLQGVLTKGTGKGFALSGQASAGKTGTTSDKKDGWFAGYTPYYTTCVWVGYDYPKTMDNLYGNTYPAYIWYEYMEQIHEGMEERLFKEYIKTWETLDPSNNDIENNDEKDDTVNDNDESEEISSEENESVTDKENDEDNEDTSSKQPPKDQEAGGIEGDDNKETTSEKTPENEPYKDEINNDDQEENSTSQDSKEEESEYDPVPDSEDDVYYSNGQVVYPELDNE